MSLLITITKAPETAALAESSKTFDTQGGSIGRGKDNNWVLDDPERFLSSCHCKISMENGQYMITDMSTNGTFFNGSPNPMGKGKSQPLNDGDSFTLGDYEFAVSLWNPVQNSSAPAQNASAGPFGGGAASIPDDDLFSPPPAPTSDLDNFGSNPNPFGGGIVSNSDSLFGGKPEETDPLAALDKAQGIQGSNPLGGFTADPFQSSPVSDPFGGPTHSDQADPLNQQVSWPDAIPDQNIPLGGGGAGAIPDDWDDDLLSPSPAPSAPPVAPVQPVVKPSVPLTEPPVVPRPAQRATPPVAPAAEIPAESPPTSAQDSFQNTGQFDATEGEISPAQQLALEKANAKIQAELEILKQQISAQKSRTSQADISVDTTLIDAMGFEDRNLVDAEITQINQLVGEVVREMVGGLMQVLGSRSSIKNEFRMNVTTIQPVENNPLKFSANIDDALENMFIKQGNAYKKPVEAVREGFDGIAEHQVAILAGIRAAFKGVIERFDPIILEERFSKQNKGGLIPGSQKAKNWELYQEYYNELAGDIDNSFQYLFGDEFVSAYEDQLQKLAIARKSKNTNKDK